MATTPFIPDEAFLERRSRQFVDWERATQDHRWGGYQHDREHDLVVWLSLIDKQRGQLAQLLVDGGRWHSFDRKRAIKQLIQVSALARRACVVLMGEIYEAEGEHVDDSLRDMFERPTENAASPRPDPMEIPF